MFLSCSSYHLHLLCNNCLRMLEFTCLG
uniref:Uncharacterized protein n=1 Tax=Rhizophora mucronata TaxID=61149 RepID=A0A2P2QS65_RHIMU